MKSSNGCIGAELRRVRAKRKMKSGASLLALAVASSLCGSAYAASNFEYSSQPNLAQIHVTKALHDDLKSMLSGTEVVLAILDGKADIRHVDLKGRETTQIVYSGNYKRYDNHGTHVSGIAGATQNAIGVVGVNPFATLLNIPVFDQKGWVATDLGKKALDAARSAGARVVNMSYGPTAKGDMFLNGELNLFQTYNSTAPGQGMVLVRAAGNSAVNVLNESFSGDASSALSNLLIVGSVNANNAISSFSNRPGSACIGSCGTNNANAAMNFWLVAPGGHVYPDGTKEYILSDFPNNYVGGMMGTSMAAPHVTGAAALVFQSALAGNTQLAPGEVAEILKLSADDLGTAGVDAIYGWGLLNVEAALAPVGTTSIPTGTTANGGGVALQGSGFSTSSAVGSRSLESALTGAIVLDAYERPFAVEAPKPSSATPAYAANFLQELTGDVFSTVTEVRNDGRSALTFTARGDLAHGGLGVVSVDNGDVHIASGLGDSVSYFTSVDGAARGAKESFSHAMAREFFTGSGDAAFSLNQAMFAGADVNATSRLTLSGIYLRTMPASFGQVPDNVSAMMLGTQLASSLVKLGANYRLTDGVTAGVSYGLLAEQGQTLGMRTAGAFSLGNGVTHVAGAHLAADITPATAIAAFAEHSTTEAYDGGSSLFASDNWSGSKYGLSLTQRGAFGLGGALRLTLARPWQVDSGSLRLHVPVGRELDGTIDYEDRMLSIAQGGMPVEIGLAYLRGGAKLKYGAEARMLNRDIAGQGFSEFSLAGALRWSF